MHKRLRPQDRTGRSTNRLPLPGFSSASSTASTGRTGAGGIRDPWWALPLVLIVGLAATLAVGALHNAGLTGLLIFGALVAVLACAATLTADSLRDYDRLAGMVTTTGATGTPGWQCTADCECHQRVAADWFDEPQWTSTVQPQEGGRGPVGL
ncbi:hypothetical protein GCM10023318_61100 [Nocardia callitridis]|uniref:Uncharacterized protein n=1 Tax=Nocardia callitridis TaxID=648753 RepID=A0ABP9L237_9NOCA